MSSSPALITTTARAATTEPGEQDAVLLAGQAAANGVAFSPDGKLLAGAYGDGTVRLWDPATGQPHDPVLQPGSGSQVSVNAVAFGSDGRLAGAYADGALRMWTVTAGGHSALAGGGWIAVTVAALAIGLSISALVITIRGIRRPDRELS